MIILKAKCLELTLTSPLACSLPSSSSQALVPPLEQLSNRETRSSFVFPHPALYLALLQSVPLLFPATLLVCIFTFCTCPHFSHPEPPSLPATSQHMPGSTLTPIPFSMLTEKPKRPLHSTHGIILLSSHVIH